MSINRQPYTGYILRAYSNDIESETQGYKTLLEVSCDVVTADVKAAEVYNYTHEVWMWNDANVVFNGTMMKLSEYMILANRIVLKEGLYFRSTFMDKTISGEIRLYSPSQLGVMLGIDTNSI
jgi:hypothetical protein